MHTKPMMPQKRAERPNRAGSLRIIAGEWRSRRIAIPEMLGVRPSSDRVRETLFNWLQQEIEGRRCLDLFAGSGALGLEALSRGASSCVFVDQSPKVCDHLRSTLTALNASHAGTVLARDALGWLQSGRQAEMPFDGVFLDPPFRAGLLPPVMEALIEGNWLTPSAWVYLEAESSLSISGLPGSWAVHRHKTTGQLQYALLHQSNGGAS